ncbi:MAG: hypothetical protein FGM24_01350 [Candidatus Kapabacteria bacterium]|nr:hypothetical protein [Candidatus Kapabacteria bacterium]
MVESIPSIPPVDVPGLDAGQHTLRLIHMAAPVDDHRIIRSAAVRLIPGLEFTSLRFEGVKQRGRRAIQQLSDPPAFREFHAPIRPMRRQPAAQPAQAQPAPSARPVSLEELAQRLERARMPRPGTAPAQPVPAPAPAPVKPSVQSTASAPVVFSETMAGIYASQGAYDLAIQVYRTLQQKHPDRHDHFQKLIDDVAATRTP